MIWSDQSLSLSLFCVCRIVDMIKRRRKDDRYTFLAAKKSSFTWSNLINLCAYKVIDMTQGLPLPQCFVIWFVIQSFLSPGISYRIYPYDNGELCIYKVENKPHNCPPLQTVPETLLASHSTLPSLSYLSLFAFSSSRFSPLWIYKNPTFFFFKAKALESWNSV